MAAAPADRREVIEQRPFTASIDPVEPTEPRLELVPALDDPETVDLNAPEAEAEQTEEAEDAPEEAAEAEALESAVQAQDPLKLYVRSIGGGPLLTRLEERELARRKDAGDEAAKRRLIEANLRLVMSGRRSSWAFVLRRPRLSGARSSCAAVASVGSTSTSSISDFSRN